MLGRRNADRQPPPTCLPELRRASFDEWCNIPQDQIDNWILSMPRRYKKIGGKTEIMRDTPIIADHKENLIDSKTKVSQIIGD
ncbi:uncharacterized protein TNCV_4872961 [Trichonephila clavipes]|nr:uncharacterized protein TNCV_4872961 [Trichonephila clavipes]